MPKHKPKPTQTQGIHLRFFPLLLEIPLTESNSPEHQFLDFRLHSPTMFSAISITASTITSIDFCSATAISNILLLQWFSWVWLTAVIGRFEGFRNFPRRVIEACLPTGVMPAMVSSDNSLVISCFALPLAEALYQKQAISLDYDINKYQYQLNKNI